MQDFKHSKDIESIQDQLEILKKEVKNTEDFLSFKVVHRAYLHLKNVCIIVFGILIGGLGLFGWNLQSNLNYVSRSLERSESEIEKVTFRADSLTNQLDEILDRRFTNYAKKNLDSVVMALEQKNYEASQASQGIATMSSSIFRNTLNWVDTFSINLSRVNMVEETYKDGIGKLEAALTSLRVAEQALDSKFLNLSEDLLEISDSTNQHINSEFLKWTQCEYRLISEDALVDIPTFGITLNARGGGLHGNGQEIMHLKWARMGTDAFEKIPEVNLLQKGEKVSFKLGDQAYSLKLDFIIDTDGGNHDAATVEICRQ